MGQVFHDISLHLCRILILISWKVVLSPNSNTRPIFHFGLRNLSAMKLFNRYGMNQLSQR